MATTPPTNNPFILSRATIPTDFTAIITCEFLTFTDPFIREVFMGPDTPSNHKTLASHYQNILHTNPADVWIKVEEKSTGKIVGASNWRIHMGSVPEHQEEDLGWEWLRGDEEKLGRVKEVVRGIAETRRRLFTEPYCREYISVLDFLLISSSSPLRS
jgi:hypothetical protein